LSLKIFIQIIGGYLRPPNELIDITDRISENSLKSFSEQMENGRFAFTASDVNIEITNFDDFLYVPVSLPTTFLTHGFNTYIFWEDVEQFRGVSYFGDVSFDDIKKTATFKTISWLKRLRDLTLTDWQAPTTLTALYSEIDERIQGVSGSPSFEPSDIDLTGVLEFEFGVEIGDSDPESGFVYEDVWRDHRNGKFFAIRRDGENISFYQIQGNEHTLKATFPIDLDAVDYVDVRIITVFYVKFIRAVASDDISGVTVKYTIRRPSVADQVRVKNIIFLQDGEDLHPTYYSAVDQNERYAITSGALFTAPTIFGNVGEIVRSDGFNLFIFSEITDGIRIEKKTRTGVLIGTYDIAENIPFDINSIDVSSLNTISWYDFKTDDGRWYWIRWESMSDFSGVVNIGDGVNIANVPIAQEYHIYPLSYAEDIYCGKFSYCLWREDLGGGAIVYDEWWTDDPIFIILSAMVYKETTLEDIITDLTQFFNGQFFVKDGTVFIINRGKSRGEFTVSTDWIEKSNFDRTLREEIEKKPFLDIRANKASDDKDNLYSTRTLMGTLRNYYKTANRWVKRTLTIPLTVAKDIRLGSKVTITETGDSGVVIERGINVENKGKMASLTIETEIT